MTERKLERGPLNPSDMFFAVSVMAFENGREKGKRRAQNQSMNWKLRSQVERASYRVRHI